jgi:hypothetical protein
MEQKDESHVPRGVVGEFPSDKDDTAATTTSAAEDTGHMQQQQQHHALGTGEPRPFTSAADEGSLFSTTATTTTSKTDTVTHSEHATGEHKESASPTDLAASPRSGATGFVAPSSYLRPLAVREDHYRAGGRPFTASQTGGKRMMTPLDREQREGLVSGLVANSWRVSHMQISTR